MTNPAHDGRATPEKGVIEVPDEPGLGVEFDFVNGILDTGALKRP